MVSQAQPSCNAESTAPNVPFIPFLSALTAWALLKFAAEYIVRRVNPQFFEDLKMDFRRRYDLYFGTWLGSIFKVVSITACATALFTTSPEMDIIGLVRPLSTVEQWCWGCRAVIYIQEIPHITAFPELIIHHILSIGAMLAILNYNIPRRQLYLAWAGLLSEFVSNARRLLKMHGKLSQRLGWWLTVANVLLILVFRVTGCFLALIWTLRSGTRGITLVINAGSWAIYFIYMLRVSMSEAARGKLVVLDLKQPAKIVIAQKWHVSLLGVIMGLGFVCTKLSMLFIYETNVKRLTSVSELQSIAWVSLQAALAGFIGSYITAPIRQLFVTRKENVGQPRAQYRRSMQGGLFLAAPILLFSPTVAKSVEKAALLACMVLSWPLLHVIGHVGYYFDGVGLSAVQVEEIREQNNKLDHSNASSSLDEKKQLQTSTTIDSKPVSPSLPPPPPPILHLQLIASLLNGFLYISLLAVRLTELISLYQAAALAFALQNIIRRVITFQRSDITLRSVKIPGITEPVLWLRIWWFVQLMVSNAILTVLDFEGNFDASGNDNNVYVSLFGVVVIADLVGAAKWSAVLVGFHIAAEGVTHLLSKPAGQRPARGAENAGDDGDIGQQRKRIRLRRGGSSKESEEEERKTEDGNNNNIESGAAARRKSRGRLVKTVSNPKFIASAAGFLLVLLVAWSVFSGSMPQGVTSLEEAHGAAFGINGNVNGTGVLGSRIVADKSRFYLVMNAFSSCQFVASMLGVALLPVVAVQVLG